MDVSKFKLEKTRAAESDPRPGWEQAAQRIATVRLHDVPADIADDILASRWRTLDDGLAGIFTSGNYLGAALLLDTFDVSLLKQVVDERTSGRLRPWSAAAEVERVGPFLSAKLYNSIEAEGFTTLLHPGERALNVGWWSIRTDRRTITREEMRAAARPVTHRNDVSWASQFPSRAAIENAESEEREREPMSRATSW